MDRLAPNLVHVCGLIWESTYVDKNVAPRDPRWVFGIYWGSKIRKSGKSTKWLDQLVPNLVHVCYFIWEWKKAKNNLPLEIPGGHFWGFKGSNIKGLGTMAKRLGRLGPNCAPYIQMALVHKLKNIGPVRHQRGHFNQRLSRGNI